MFLYNLLESKAFQSIIEKIVVGEGRKEARSESESQDNYFKANLIKMVIVYLRLALNLCKIYILEL